MSMLGFFFGDSYRHRARRDQCALAPLETALSQTPIESHAALPTKKQL